MTQCIHRYMSVYVSVYVYFDCQAYKAEPELDPEPEPDHKIRDLSLT